MRRAMIFASIGLVALGAGACAADSQSELSQEVLEQVAVGMPIDRAKAALEDSGFQCGPPSPLAASQSGALCSRTRAHRMVGSCVHQIDLVTSADTGTVIDIQALPPACTGL